MFQQVTTVYHEEPPVQSSEEEAVRSWRFAEFVRLGFDNSAAFALMQTGADLGVARRLVRDGCPLGTALAILH